ncbi:hypothetical protein FHY16_002190 [Xanthomonas campestris]|nr:hypothetical protein [Xanthomonas euroxanthea]
MLGRFLKSALLGVCILLAALVALYAVSRRWPISEPQRQALAQLRQPPPPLRGTNMFVALWSLSYAMPEARRESLLAEDVERFNSMPAGTPFQSALALVPGLPHWPSSAPALCSASADGCLERVRQNPQAYADALATQAPLLARLRALATYADYRSPFRADITAPLPEPPRLPLSMTGNAVDFAHGRTQQALSGVCADAQTARVLLRSGDNLVMPLIGAAMLRGNAHLFADMLAELPAQHPLPAQCATAFAPLAVDEITLCNALHGESRMAFSLLQERVLTQNGDLSWEERLSLRVFDRERTQALLAPTYTWACSAPVRALLAQDRPVAAGIDPGASNGVGGLRRQCDGLSAGKCRAAGLRQLPAQDAGHCRCPACVVGGAVAARSLDRCEAARAAGCRPATCATRAGTRPAAWLRRQQPAAAAVRKAGRKCT